jgi:hypothetical protein
LPDCFTAKNFMDGHGFTPNRPAVMQLRNQANGFAFMPERLTDFNKTIKNEADQLAG